MIIIDASVGLKWLLVLDEKYVKESRLFLEKHLDGKENILVPDLFLYELSNVLATKTPLSIDKAIKLIEIIYSYKLTIIHPSKETVIKASNLAKKHKTSVYDMLYAVIAKENKAILVTADAKFIEKTGFKFVKHIKDY